MFKCLGNESLFIEKYACEYISATKFIYSLNVFSLCSSSRN